MSIEEKIKYARDCIKENLGIDNGIVEGLLNEIDYLKGNCISKQVIRDKIKEKEENLDNLYNSSSYGDRCVAERIETLKNEIECYKELLEEK